MITPVKLLESSVSLSALPSLYSPMFELLLFLSFGCASCPFSFSSIFSLCSLLFVHVFLHYGGCSLLFSNHFPGAYLLFDILKHLSQDVAWSRDLLISCVIAVYVLCLLISKGSYRLFAVHYWRTSPVTTISLSQTEWRHHCCFILDSNFWLLQATLYLSSTIIAVLHQNWHFGRF